MTTQFNEEYYKQQMDAFAGKAEKLTDEPSKLKCGTPFNGGPKTLQASAAEAKSGHSCSCGCCNEEDCGEDDDNDDEAVRRARKDYLEELFLTAADDNCDTASETANTLLDNLEELTKSLDEIDAATSDEELQDLFEGEKIPRLEKLKELKKALALSIDVLKLSCIPTIEAITDEVYE